uniref:Uncharacterized protein n=1 Tax=Brassica oleracea TaxID=3712 RepID=A0A3P6AZT7_BRAOL|nr:unnamed protein product [Brassica oleracea]
MCLLFIGLRRSGSVGLELFLNETPVLPEALVDDGIGVPSISLCLQPRKTTRSKTRGGCRRRKRTVTVSSESKDWKNKRHAKVKGGYMKKLQSDGFSGTVALSCDSISNTYQLLIKVKAIVEVKWRFCSVLSFSRSPISCQIIVAVNLVIPSFTAEVPVKQCPFFSFPLSTPKIFSAPHLAMEPQKDSATANWAAALLHYAVEEAMEASLAAVDRPRGAASNTSNEGSVGSVNMVLILKQEVKHLQHKLEEARADLNAKEARIQELEYSKIEYEFEGIFRERSKLESSTWCQERGVCRQ